jgi:tRNA (cytidine/uridine-2'-O-)-methyltransferase
MRIALYQPDIPQNVGAILRLAACLGVAVDIIGPCGFPFSDKSVRRAGLDYMDRARIARHDSWAAFRDLPRGRLVLLTTSASLAYTAFSFDAEDTILLGQESAGAPGYVHDAAGARLTVPMTAGARSLNVVTATAIVLSEALRQTGGFPATSENARGTEP